MRLSNVALASALAVSAVFSIGFAADAPSRDPAITDRSTITSERPALDRADIRQANQRERIAQGIKSGELTRPETRKLIRNQRHINRTERRVEADGKLTLREKVKLERMQDRQSRRIAVEKHDGQERK